jgi:hypothetical protein
MRPEGKILAKNINRERHEKLEILTTEHTELHGKLAPFCGQ